jgi:hypothetical protein
LISYEKALPQSVDMMEIADFLARPHQVAIGSFTTLQTRGQTILSQDISNQFNANNMWKLKLAGYKYIRATAVYRLQVNAQPFQAGRLLLHVLPLAQEYTRANNYYTAAHNATLTDQTQHPNVELDLQETAAILRVPYVSPTLYYDRINNEYDHGKIYLTVLSPLSPGSASTSVGYTLWLHWEDVQVNGPIFGPESGLQPKVNNIDREERAIKNNKMLPNLLKTVMNSPGVLNSIPKLGDISRTVSDFASAVSIFGFAKPNSSSSSTPMIVAPQKNMANSDGISSADTFALQHSAELPVVSGFGGSDLDEMNFTYLKQIPAYHTHFTISTTDVYATNVYTQLIGPRHIRITSDQVQPTVTRKITSSPAFIYLSRFFKYWRGGIRVTIKFIKTAYHSGRVMIIFNTGIQSVSANESEYVLREIVDLRTTNEVTICLPYLKHTNYLKTEMNDGRTLNDELRDRTSSGFLQVMVLNPLQAASTVGSSIDCLVYYSAAEDYELTYPTNVNTCNFIPFTPESGLANNAMNCTSIGSTSDQIIDPIHLAMCTADPFTSIKQLLLCYRIVTIPFEGSATDPNIAFWPFALSAYVDINASNSDFGALDYIAQLSSGFVLARGGVKFYVPSGTPSTTMRAHLQSTPRNLDRSVYEFNATAFTETDRWNSQVSEYANIASSSGLAMTYSKNCQWGLEVLVPHASATPSRLNVYQNTVPRSIWANDSVLILGWADPNTSFTTGSNSPFRRLYRSGADDLCLSYFIGFGPWVVTIVL